MTSTTDNFSPPGQNNSGLRITALFEQLKDFPLDSAMFIGYSISMENNTRKCCKCKVNKPANEFWKNASTKSGLQSCCKECCRIINRKAWKLYCRRHPERKREAQKRYAQTEKGKEVEKKKQKKYYNKHN